MRIKRFPVHYKLYHFMMEYDYAREKIDAIKFYSSYRLGNLTCRIVCSWKLYFPSKFQTYSSHFQSLLESFSVIKSVNNWEAESRLNEGEFFTCRTLEKTLIRRLKLSSGGRLKLYSTQQSYYHSRKPIIGSFFFKDIFLNKESTDQSEHLRGGGLH